MSQSTASVTARVAKLSDAKARLLKHLFEQKAKAADALVPVERASHGSAQRAVTSWAQQRLWFVNQYDGGSASYNIPLGIRLRGRLDAAALARALETIVRRHETLRTVFVAEDGMPYQEIRSEPFPMMLTTDLSGCAPDVREGHVLEYKVREAHDPFDLVTGPLIRARLLRLSEDEHVLLITMHHIVSDGWSLGVFSRELERLYNSYCRGEPHSLKPLTVQYADYAHWQRRWLCGKEFDAQLKYWCELLKNAPQLEVPTDRPRPSTQSYRGGNLPVSLSPKLCSRLRATAKAHGMTLFMVLLAAWGILLARLSGQEEVVIGTPTANRRRPELEGLIGFFVNTLALRLGVDSGLRLSQFLEHVRAATLAAYAHQDVPFERVVEAVQPERHLNRSPLFQVMFALQNAPRAEMRLVDLTVTAEAGVDEPSIFDLFLSLEERGEEIAGSLSYAADLFERRTLERWMRCFEVLLWELTSPADQTLDRLRIMPANEVEQVVRAFNDTFMPIDRQRLLHEIFEEQVRRTPAAPAVVHATRSISYQDLNTRADRLAAYLQSRGVQRESLVAVCLERGIDMIVSVLAVIKAGGAYVPLDPNYPAERLQYMIEDASPALVLTQDKLRHLFPSIDNVVSLSGDPTSLAPPLAEPAAGTAGDFPARAEQLIYVIYTSGSTGRPKGTAMPHRAMANLIEWHRAAFSELGPQRVLQFAALSFDVAFQEVFSTLCTGSTLYLLDEEIRRDARALLGLLIDSAIQRLFMPPLMLQALAEASVATNRVPTHLTDVIVAGEQLRVTAEVRQFFQRLEGCRLHNHYGPTETHVVTSLTLEGASERWPSLPSIGKPIWNTQIYVLDRAGAPVPQGVAGEIYIGGMGVARGYLRRPDLTSQRFVEHRVDGASTTILYRTGDVGRWRDDGTIEYLGRNDDQVKIRGYRIELGEIESQLRRQEAVKEAAVIAREDVPGDKRLVAYVTHRPGTQVDVETVRRQLASSLPQFMVPGAIVVLDAFPLTPSGKLNRRELPIPDAAAFAARAYEPPQGEIEEALADLWRSLLRVDRVGRLDNFFELGGHSLLGMRLIARVTERFGIHLPVIAIFQHPTVQQLAGVVRSLKDSGDSDADLARMEFDEGSI